MNKFLTLLFVCLSISLVSAIGVSPTSACAGTTFTITITGVNYTAASSGCSPISINVAGLTSGSNTNIVANPTSMSIASSTMTMTFTLSGSFAAGTYGINMNNTCPNVGSCLSCFTVNAIPQLTGNITGPILVCKNDTVAYSVTPAAGADSYLWNFPGGWDNSLATTTAQSSIGVGTNNGSIGVSPVSTQCGTGNTLLLGVTVVQGAPAANAVSANGAVLTSSSTSAAQQWFLDGNLIAGATGQNYTALVTGDYTVVEANICGAGASSAAVHVVISGINSLINNKILIYPNPTSDNLFIENGNTAAIKVELFSLEGKLIQILSVEKHGSLSMTNLAAGIYNLKITNGTKISFDKIVKQ